jgi:hypothetical protein
VYKVTTGGGDVATVNIRLSSNQGCKIIGTIKVGTIVAIRSTNSDTTECENTDGQKITLYRLSEDRGAKEGRYIAANNLSKRGAEQVFNNNNQAKIVSPKGLRIRGGDCKLLNETDKSIPKTLPNGALVTLPDPNNVKTTTCDIVDPILYRFEMVEVEFQYKKGKDNVKGTGYVAQEFLRPA